MDAPNGDEGQDTVQGRIPVALAERIRRLADTRIGSELHLGKRPVSAFMVMAVRNELDRLEGGVPAPSPPVRPSPLPSRLAPSPEPDEPEDVEQPVPITPPAATPPTAAPVPVPPSVAAEERAMANARRGRPSHSTAPPLMTPEPDGAVKGEAPRVEVNVEVLADQIRKDKRRGLETGAREALLARETARSDAAAKPAAPQAAAEAAPLFSTFTCKDCGQVLPLDIFDAHKKTHPAKEIQAALPSEAAPAPSVPAIPVPDLDRLERFVLQKAGAGTISELLVIARDGLADQHIPENRQPADDILKAWLRELAKKNAAGRRTPGRPSA